MTGHENLPPKHPAHPIDVPVYDFVEPTPIESTTKGDWVIAVLLAAILIVVAAVVLL